MGMNAVLIGQLIAFSTVIMVGPMCYYYGRRKTQHPIAVGILGVILGFLPPLGFIFLAFILLKNDIPKHTTVNSEEVA
ncbi:hypothetical protein V1358_09415 [Pseudoalteromonas sp. YIC-656]|uniref:hypothetical protein n=1 Tax=Pseudoalteromonas pernae TaxID=3118054 RepID=UPI003241EE67